MESSLELFLKFLEDVSPFCGATDTLFWTSGDVSSGFQSQSGQPYSHLIEAYVIYIPWDSDIRIQRQGFF